MNRSTGRLLMGEFDLQSLRMAFHLGLCTQAELIRRVDGEIAVSDHSRFNLVEISLAEMATPQDFRNLIGSVDSDFDPVDEGRVFLGIVYRLLQARDFELGQAVDRVRGSPYEYSDLFQSEFERIAEDFSLARENLLGSLSEIRVRFLNRLEAHGDLDQADHVLGTWSLGCQSLSIADTLRAFERDP